MDWNILIDVFLKKNSELNLSAIRDEEGVRVKHINDSLKNIGNLNIKAMNESRGCMNRLMISVNAYCYSCPDIEFIGIDSVKKKTVAVNEMLETLGVKNAKVIWTRMEEYKGEVFDVVTARAVAYSDKLIKWANPLLKKGGYFLFMKQVIEEEKEVLKQLCKKYHLNIEKELKYKLYEDDIERVIYVIKKN